MRVLRYVFALLMTFAMALSFAVPLGDVPETPYDESESMPYEMTSPLSPDLVRESALASEAAPILLHHLFFLPERPLSTAALRELPAQYTASFTIFNRSLRC